MIKFLLKGLLRDSSRSRFPLLTVVAGSMLTVMIYSWITGISGMMISAAAGFSAGHVKIMSRAYAKEAEQIPNDLALLKTSGLLERLRGDFPNQIWIARIRFGGLLDIPDESGETRTQGPVAGIGVDLFSPSSPEPRILNLEKSLVRGRMARRPGEILISEDFARRLGAEPGQRATLIGSTMNGGMAMANFSVAGTVRFGIAAVDHGALIADIEDIRKALDMEDAAGEILGFSSDFIYRPREAEALTARFNAAFSRPDDEFSPEMLSFREASGLAAELDMFDYFSTLLVFIFLTAMSIVLWNAGLMGSLRRYGEIGLRMALGEDKGRVYRSLIAESLMIGIAGSVLGTVLGLAVSYYLQIKGVDVASIFKNSTVLLPTVVRARVTAASYYIGFIPGLLATLLGTSISGIGIYRRQTARLTKELEA